jgi:transcriptional repressor NrdR
VTELRCPFCKEDSDKVIDSRASEGGRVIRRRRECMACTRRFTTYEKASESFKVIAGLQKACYKRAVSAEQIQEIADKVEEDIFKKYDREVASQTIGELVMKHLRTADKVAYIRFASVYRDFKDAGEFIDQVKIAMEEPGDGGEPTLFTNPK